MTTTTRRVAASTEQTRARNPDADGYVERAARALDVREPTIGSRVFRARGQLALAADG